MEHAWGTLGLAAGGYVFSTPMARYVNWAVRQRQQRTTAWSCRRLSPPCRCCIRSPQVAIFTDSRYVIDGLTKWLPAWRRRGWVTSTNTPVKNRDLWLTLEGLNHSGVRWQHVYGHRGDPNNERVDTIARACAAGTCPALFCGQSGAPDDPVMVSTATALPTQSASETSARLQVPAPAPGRAYYVSIVHGTAALDTDWPACAARVRGMSGAQYRKVRTPEELAAFCAAHGVEPPQGLA